MNLAAGRLLSLILLLNNAVSFAPLMEQSLHSKNESTYYDSCSSLESTGIIPYAIAESEYSNIRTHVPMTMRFPPPLHDYYLNVPTKSGTENWAALMYRLWFGKVPSSFHMDVKPVEKKFMASHNDFFNKRLQQVWMLVRNPYVRLLSIYLDKVSCADVLYENKDFISSTTNMFRNFGALTFEEYVIALTNHVLFDSNCGKPELPSEFIELWVRSGGLLGKEERGRFQKMHIGNDLARPYHLEKLSQQPYPCAQFSKEELMRLIDPTGRVQQQDFPPDSVVPPIERAKRLCNVDIHTCAQAGGLFRQPAHRVRVLRLEEQQRWYPQFLSCFNISYGAVISEEWRNFSGKPCFYTPTDSCADALRVWNGTGLVRGNVHSHAALTQMDTHYTPLAAKLAMYLYEYDIIHLGYQPWDGIKEFNPMSAEAS